MNEGSFYTKNIDNSLLTEQRHEHLPEFLILEWDDLPVNRCLLAGNHFVKFFL